MVPWLPWLVTKNQTELNRIKQLPVTPVSISSGQSFRTLAQRRSDDLTSVGPGDVTYHPIAVHRFDVKTWLVSNQVWYIAVQKIKGLIGIYRENIWKYLVLLHFTITVRIMTDPMTRWPIDPGSFRLKMGRPTLEGSAGIFRFEDLDLGIWWSKTLVILWKKTAGLVDFCWRNRWFLLCFNHGIDGDVLYFFS